MKLRTFQDKNEFKQAAVDIVSEICRLPQESIPIALSGGSTPKDIYKGVAMCAESPFKYLEIFQVDERYVPPESDKSNRRLIEETLLSNSSKKIKATHYFDTSLPIDDCLKKYEKELPKIPFELIILGIGPDGHTASLFPGLTALDETEKKVAYTTTDEFDVFDRLTLSFAPIMDAKKILVLLKGEQKKAVIDELREGPLEYHEFPAKKLLEHPDLEILYLEK